MRTEGRRDFIRQWRPSRGASLQAKQVAADPKSHGHQEHCGGGRISVSDARGGCRCGEPRAVFRPGRLGTLLTGVLVERLGLDRLLRCRPRSPRQRSSTDDCCSWQPSATKHCAPKGGQPARHLPPGAAIGAPIGGLTRLTDGQITRDLRDLISDRGVLILARTGSTAGGRAASGIRGSRAGAPLGPKALHHHDLIGSANGPGASGGLIGHTRSPERARERRPSRPGFTQSRQSCAAHTRCRA